MSSPCGLACNSYQRALTQQASHASLQLLINVLCVFLAACIELFLGNKGIEKLRGFESFVNLQSLWLNNNRLKKVNNLEANFRIRTLYVQVRRVSIETAKGLWQCNTCLFGLIYFMFRQHRCMQLAWKCQTVSCGSM